MRAYLICDNRADCVSGVDEKDCEDKNNTCLSNNVGYQLDSQTRVLNSRNKCSVPEIYRGEARRVCHDYRDQMNCSYSTFSPLTCNVEGYPTTLSEHVICKGHDLCDDNLDSMCVEVEHRCTIHRHKLCDGVRDCLKGVMRGMSSARRWVLIMIRFSVLDVCLTIIREVEYLIDGYRME